jgi:hypothetical protein
VRWVARLFGTGLPHLTPTLSAPQGGEGDIPAAWMYPRKAGVRGSAREVVSVA